MKLNEAVSGIASIATALLSSTTDAEEKWYIIEDLLHATQELNRIIKFPPHKGNIPEASFNNCLQSLIFNQQVRVCKKLGNYEQANSIKEKEAGLDK